MIYFIDSMYILNLYLKYEIKKYYKHKYEYKYISK